MKGETIILEGSPADVIVDYAKNGYDLIVIGSKGKDATERTLLEVSHKKWQQMLLNQF